MKKKIAVLITLVLLSTTIFAEIELGLSFTPGDVLVTEETAAAMQWVGADSTSDESLLGFHFGYSFWWLFYASYDSLIVPPWFVYQTTTYTEADGTPVSGINAPGFMNFLDFGIRPKIGPIYLLATIGFNDLYIHSQYEQVEDAGLGVNLRIGAGYQFGAFSINFTGTSMFNSFDQLSATMSRLSDQEPGAMDDFMSRIIPSIGFVLHL
ncbi:hypothetical protein EW093_16080 [Thiospirochaeta perfilievii]|uniref:Outer membrane protein beta-barrel domain-containing protein n=1 Tax=Thiospirochaeta perfilievii TaxID=252967 RepID=A0A5C1QG78_9SPIO|nr:hypothetical protein [Thiospirochaeta perfilievii]QEN06140.1 hypothetical protein EW093_16080 [Thiospirochaeta perfilievii]